MRKEVEIIKASTELMKRKQRNQMEQIRVAAYCRVSTDSEDQLSSYRSQMQYYNDLIKSKSEWVFSGVYADEAITGTQVAKREEFQRLVNDCMNGEIDMVITKSISRFARNTLDTLKYVRMLKERNVAVFFEDENINTLTMDGELLLVILSSVAQQEVENISANVKKGLKMKMQRGELIGFQGCLGYDYDREDKSISVNEEEAEVVRYIFRRYIEGAGASIIGQELRNLGYKTKRGNITWQDTTVIGIIKNEKYKGDILMGKTFTVDPISKRRLNNKGEEDQYYIRDHHQAIISEEMFNEAQEILRRRSQARNIENGSREKFSRQYAFSCLMKCGFCGGTLTRRSWHNGTPHKKTIWHCVVSTKKGKQYCPESKALEEAIIENAFLQAFRIIKSENSEVLEDFYNKAEAIYSNQNTNKELVMKEKEIDSLLQKRAKLVDLRLDEKIHNDAYDEKYIEISTSIIRLEKECAELKEIQSRQQDVKRHIDSFRKTLESHSDLEVFDRHVFESVVDHIIIGGYDKVGDIDPSMITFIFKSGMKKLIDGEKIKHFQANSKPDNGESIVPSHTINEDNKLPSYSSEDTC